MKDKLRDLAERAKGYRYQASLGDGNLKLLAIPLLVVLLLLALLGVYWSDEPGAFDVEAASRDVPEAA